MLMHRDRAISIMNKICLIYNFHNRVLIKWSEEMFTNSVGVKAYNVFQCL